MSSSYLETEYTLKPKLKRKFRILLESSFHGIEYESIIKCNKIVYDEKAYGICS